MSIQPNEQNNKEKQGRKGTPLLLLAIGGVLFGLVGVFLWLSLSKEVADVRLAKEKLADSLFTLGIIAEGDTYFMRGKIDSAFAIYENLPTTQKEGIIEDRQEALTQLRLNMGLRQDTISVPVSTDDPKGLASLKEELYGVYAERGILRDSLFLARMELESYKSGADNSPPVRFQWRMLKSSKGDWIGYVGELNGETAEGRGVGVWETGSIYDGEWKDNKRHGKGIFVWKDGIRYEGEFVEDRREGFGKYTWKNGEFYEGEWKNNRRHGFGTFYTADKKPKFRGNWEKDKFVD